MKSGTQSKLNMLIMNIVLEIDDLDPNLYIQVNLDPTQKFPPTFMKFGTHNKFDMLIMNIMLASSDYWLRMITGCKIQLTVRT